MIHTQSGRWHSGRFASEVPSHQNTPESGNKEKEFQITGHSGTLILAPPSPIRMFLMNSFRANTSAWSCSVVPGITANTNLWLPSLNEHILLEFAVRVYVFEEHLASCSAVFPALFLRARSAPGAVIRSPITSAFPSKICWKQLLSDDHEMIPFSAAIWSGVLPSVVWIARLAPCAAVSAATTSKLP